MEKETSLQMLSKYLMPKGQGPTFKHSSPTYLHSVQIVLCAFNIEIILHTTTEHTYMAICHPGLSGKGAEIITSLGALRCSKHVEQVFTYSRISVVMPGHKISSLALLRHLLLLKCPMCNSVNTLVLSMRGMNILLL